MRRKFLSVVLCVCMMLTMAPFAFAAGETEIQASTTELSNGSYILKNDITLTSGALTIPENATVSINLNNHKLTNKDGDHTILNNGTLTITGRGTVDNVSNGTAALYNNAGATVTLNGGTYTRSCEASTSADNSGGNSYYTLKNFGTMTINPGVTVNQGQDGNGKYSSLVANGWFDGSTQGQAGKEPAIKNGGAKMTINGGTFNGGLNTIKNDDYGTIIINGGTFQNYAQACFLNWNEGTVNGGYFNGAESASAVILNGYLNDTMDKGTLNITGGIFNGATVIKNMQDGKKEADLKNVTLSGGIFSSLDSSIKLADGYKTATIGENSVVVTDTATPVATVGQNGFASAQNAFDAVQNDETITLLADCTAGTYNEAYIPSGKSVTLDLNDKTLTIGADCGIELQGELTITGNGKITCANTPIRVNGSSAKLTVDSGTIESTGDYGIYAMNGGSVVVNDGTLTAYLAVLSGNNTTGDMNFEVNGGTLTSQLSEAIYMPGQVSLKVTGGTINGGISTRMGQITVTGGTINGMTGDTDSISDYYHYSGSAWIGDAIYVLAGTYSSKNQDYQNSCNITISGGTINGNSQYGLAVYKIGTGSKQTVNVNITGGKFSGSKGAVAVVDSGFEHTTCPPNNTPHVSANPTNVTTSTSISGGYFTTDPSDYCDEGLTGIPSTEPGYAFTVGTAAKEVKPATAAPNVDASKISDTTDKATAKEVSESVTDTNNVLSAAASDVANSISPEQVTQAKEQLKKDLSISDNSTTIYTYAQAYLKVTPTDVKKSGNTITSITMDIQPMYRVVASTKDKANEIILVSDETAGKTKNAIVLNGSDTKLTNIQTMKISLELPSTFTVNNDNQVYVQHKGHEYIATVTTGENSKQIATFTNPDGFSTFTISSTSTAVAKIGDNRYTSLQDAVDASNDKDVIEIIGGNSPYSATMSGSSRTITVKNGTAGEIKVTINGTEKTLAAKNGENAGGSAEFTYTRPSHNGSGSTSTTYNVNVNAATNGAVAADKKTASKGTTVTVTASPSKGYVVDAVKVVDKDGKDVAVTEKDGKYVFTMPGSAVTVTGSFKAETPAPVALPFTDVKSGNWFYDAVKYAYAQGLMTGTSATTFAPNGTMNRAMIVTVLYRLEKSPAVTGASKFTDVPAGQWYSDAVAWAAANKIVNGYDETTFGPMNAVTREQMAAILFRYEQVKGLENVTLEENLNRFPDQNKISAYAIPALQWAVGQKIINGNADGTLDPTGTATRAQVAQIFTNLLNK